MTHPVVQHNDCVADVWDVTVLCLQSLGCVVLQTAKGYVLTGIRKYWVSSADVFC